MEWREAMEAVLARRDLDEGQAEALLGRVLAGEASPEWIAGFLVGLRMKGESVGEITGFARAMRAHATPIRCRTGPLVDTCGTGGDDSGSFNISTTAAFVVAAAGGRVAKHGNRSVSSRCGSADVLEALGARLDLSPDDVGHCVDEVGLGFLFAPALHGAMKHAVGPRRALSVRTVFNMLGPLTNPAGAPHQVIGVYDATLLEPMGRVLDRLGARRAILVHGSDGLDEFTVTGPSRYLLVEGGEVELRDLDPGELGLPRHEASALAGGDAAANAAITREVLGGRPGAAADVVALNAGAALWAAGIAGDLPDGLARAQGCLADGSALALLDRFVEFTNDHGGGAGA